MSNDPEELEEDEALVPAVSNSAFCAWNFTPDGDSSYTCRNCKHSDVKDSGGWTNLIKHCCNRYCYGTKYVPKEHPNYRKYMQKLWKPYWAAKAEEQASARPVFKSLNSPLAKKVFGWIELIVKCNMPISICENPVMRRNTKLPEISRKTLRRDIIKLADIVGLAIKKAIGPGNCVADGWSTAGVHYFAVIHRWPVMTKGGHIQVKKALLSCQPLISETTLDAENTAESIKATYELYGSLKDLVVCFTLDNTNVNPATTRILERPMIGAYCHRLNLASRVWMAEAFHGDLMDHLEVIHAIMKRASTLKGRGALKDHTPYCPEIANKTRWTGFHDMAIKYEKIHKALQYSRLYDHVKDEEMETIEVQDMTVKGSKPTTKSVKPTLLTGPSLSEFTTNMLPALSTLKRWFEVIQKTDINLAEARQAFDMARAHLLLKGHSAEYEDRLKPTHKLVVAPAFESGIEKIINECTETLTEDEKNACKCLLRAKWKHLYPKNAETTQATNSETTGDPNSPTKFMKRMGSTKKATTEPLQSRYLTDLTWVSPTTVEVERLFSLCKRIMTVDRRRMTPRIFEAVVFLKQNEDWWNLKMVQEMVSGQWDDALGSEYNMEDDTIASGSLDGDDEC